MKTKYPETNRRQTLQGGLGMSGKTGEKCQVGRVHRRSRPPDSSISLSTGETFPQSSRVGGCSTTWRTIGRSDQKREIFPDSGDTRMSELAIRNIVLTFLFSISSVLPQRGVTLYYYDAPLYPEVERLGDITEADSKYHTDEGKSLDYIQVEADKFNRVFYKPGTTFPKTGKIAIEVNWQYISDIDMQMEIDEKVFTFALLSRAGTGNKPEGLDENNPISTHFIHNRISKFITLLTETDYREQPSVDVEARIHERLERLLRNEISVVLLIRFEGNQQYTQYGLVPRKSGPQLQFDRTIDLSFSYVDEEAIGNVFISIPFRYRATRPTQEFLDLRWLGDITSFGPIVIVEKEGFKPVGIGGFFGVGLSQSGQMAIGVSLGYINPFSDDVYKSVGLSYNVVGFVQGLIDLANGKAAWGSE